VDARYGLAEAFSNFKHEKTIGWPPSHFLSWKIFKTTTVCSQIIDLSRSWRCLIQVTANF
jgi:hypothetical protein